MHRYSTAAARIPAPLAAALLALGCTDSLSPAHRGPGAPIFADGGAYPLPATFDAGADGFSYRDDPFRGTAAPVYASGVFSAASGFTGRGLQVLLGGLDATGVLGMSGGWTTTFTLDAPEDVTLTLRYQLTQASEYESDEYSEALVSVDGILRGVAGTDRLARLTGDGNGGSPQTTGWQQVELVIPGLAAGTHTVVIGAYNSKKTAANETTELLIDDVTITGDPGVTISQAPGDLTIATATTGEGQPAGYTMNVTAPDGTPFTLTFAATESKTFTGVAGGDYRLEITEMPGNCALASGTNPRTVTVPDGGAASTTFEITCTGTATSGTLMIATATTGESQPQGYTLHIEGPGGMADPTIGATDTVTFPNVAIGDYTVELGAVRANCTVSTANGPNPRTVTVPAADTGRTTFDVTCTPTTTTGDLTIATATTGESTPVGYTMSVTAPDGTLFTLTFAATDSKTFPGIAAGDYRLEITDMPANCALASGTNPRTVTVPAGGSASTTFQVSCTATTPPPVANFTFACSDLTCSFDASSSTAQANATYSWNWGDGTPAGSGKTATHTYGAAGSYSVTLTVTDAGGSSTKTQTVPVTAPNQPPVANFTFSCNGLACSFTSTSSDPDGSITAYSWTFGDGTSSTAQNPSHTYAAGGTYTVRLTVTDNRGGTASASKSVTVNQPPVANFTFSCNGLACSFTSTSSDPDGSITAYSWTFGDGTSSTAQNPSHTYAAGGTYTVKLTVTDNRGATASASKSVTVNQPPVANFTFSCNGLTCSFTSTSSDPDGSITAYSWTFGDGTSSTAQNPSYTYAAGGTYTVKLTVTDNRGATASASKSVTVTVPNQAPTVNAGSDETVLLGVLYELNASFSDPDNGPWTGTIYWGDGTSTTGTKTSSGPISATHNYLLPGSYTIRVTVTDSRGASGSDTKVLTVLTNLGGIL
jgi:PKD repeat protein